MAVSIVGQRLTRSVVGDRAVEIVQVVAIAMSSGSRVEDLALEHEHCRFPYHSAFGAARFGMINKSLSVQSNSLADWMEPTVVMTGLSCATAQTSQAVSRRWLAETKLARVCCERSLVRKRGFEPRWYYYRQPLKLVEIAVLMRTDAYLQDGC